MSAPTPAAADRNLLFGILALQTNFVRQDALIAAMHAWVLDKSKSLGRILGDQGQLPDERRRLLDALVDEHLKEHHGDAPQSLAALSSAEPARRLLAGATTDEDVRASLAWLGDPDPHGTTAERPPSTHRYQVVRPHARGGLGDVFVALDTELHREVALKEIRPQHAHDPRSRSRFVQEAEITGGLEHPGVVPVYGLGSHGDGRPFYAMRFIRGDSLQEAIERFHKRPVVGQRPPGFDSLAFRQLLGRFVDVCQAVAYAHSRGVLHRDLKPANIMLGPYGETLVVDWGVAKVVGRESSGDAATAGSAGEPTLAPGSGVAATAAGAALGTPAYMSPEQAAGKVDELGPATDVYSLGATLYALLVGQPPVAGTDVGAVLRKVQQGDWPAPRAVNPAVPPALDAICRKAMAPRPAERYATPLALAGDLEHWLADEPVSALREPPGARACRWARKHPGPVAGLAAAVLVGLLGLGISAPVLGQKNHELERARRAEADRAEAETQANERAQQRLAQVVKGTEVLASVFHDLDPRSEEKDGKELRVLLGERLGEAVTQLEGEAVGDPLAVARLQQLLGKALRELGHLGEAEAVLAKARQTFARLRGADHPDTLDCTNSLALACQARGRYGEAEALLEQALEAGRRTVGPDHPDTLTSLHNLAGAYADHGRYEEAETLFQQAVEARRRALGADHPDTLTSMNTLALLYRKRDRADRAEPLLRQVLEGRRRRLGADHPGTLISMNNLALLYQDRGRYDEAEALYRQVLEARRRKLGADHPRTLTSTSNLAGLYHDRRRYAESEALYKQVLEAQRRTLGADHPDTLHVLNALAVLYRRRGRFAEAEPLYQQALEGRRRTLGADHPDTLTSMHNLAMLYTSLRKPERAIPLFEEALAQREKKLGTDHPATLGSLANLGVSYREVGRLDDAVRCLEQALAVGRKRPGSLPADLTWIPRELVTTYERTNQLDKAEALYRDPVERVRQRYGTDDPRTAGALAQLGLNLLRQYKHADAEKVLRDCLALREKKEPDAWTTFNTRSLLGEALLGQKHHADAEPLLKAGYEGLKRRQAKLPPQGQARLTEALQRLVQLYDAWGKPDEAARWRQRLDALRTNEPRPPASKP
jgi:serine/threonine protein kinase/tetratricopeptide (TPR) repeat protein